MKLNLYAVEWIDAYMNSPGWTGILSTECSTTINHTVGFKIEKNKRHISLAQSICFDNDTITGIVTIPRGCIKSIKKIGKVKC